MLSDAGVYTHLVTDHRHYWGDGGATYHGRFDSHEFFRGQEGDAWKGHVADPVVPDSVIKRADPVWRQDWINRQYMAEEADHPQTRTFDAGIHFMQTNMEEDGWFLQIEAFDPHEPFFSYDNYRSLYEKDYTGRQFDWPAYRRVIEEPGEVEHLKNEYTALLTMCDFSLGRVLDAMDAHALWDDTLLIVGTDHGLLLGEHGWWGKNVQPWYDENIHTPLFIWDPRAGVSGARRDALVQTIDIGPTLLDFFGLAPTEDMQGKPLGQTISTDAAVRDAALFGNAGGHVNVTDGRYVYMRSCVDADNGPLFDYTLMPMHMASRFSPAELREAELVAPFSFTKGVPVLKVPAFSFGSPYVYGTLLFDLQADPHQEHPLRDAALELHMAQLLVDLMRATDAPVEQFERLGLPVAGAVTEEHLLVERQWPQVERSRGDAALPSDFAEDAVVARATVGELLADDWQRAIVLETVPFLANPFMLRMAGGMTLVEIAAMKADLDLATLEDLEERLSAVREVA
jgi:hypothetical protein